MIQAAWHSLVLLRTEQALAGTPDPKPAKRLRAVPSEWDRLRDLKLGPCRVCSEQGTDLHHLCPRSQRGSDVADNLVPLCRTCHELVERRDETAAVRLGASLTTNECAYVIFSKGWWYLAERYRVVQKIGDYIVTGVEEEAA